MDNITYDKDLPDIGAPFALQYLNGLLLESRAKLDICIFSASLAYRLTSDKTVRKHLESATKEIGDIHTAWLSANSTTATIKDWIAEISTILNQRQTRNIKAIRRQTTISPEVSL